MAPDTARRTSSSSPKCGVVRSPVRRRRCMNSSFEAEFTGKHALVTGGTRGMGEAIVARLRSSGATVMTTARSTPHDLTQPDLFVEADISTAEGAGKIV